MPLPKRAVHIQHSRYNPVICQLCLVQGDLQVAGLKGSSADAQPVVAAVHEKQIGDANGALADADVHRILAHRRAYLKQQRAFDRACVGTEQFAFDPTQVKSVLMDIKSASQTSLQDMHNTILST